jgi:hypothetical protein
MRHITLLPVVVVPHVLWADSMMLQHSTQTNVSRTVAFDIGGSLAQNFDQCTDSMIQSPLRLLSCTVTLSAMGLGTLSLNVNCNDRAQGTVTLSPVI